MSTTLYALIRISIEKRKRVSTGGTIYYDATKGIGESAYERIDPTYGAYEGDQFYAHQSADPSFAQPLRGGLGGKVYPEPRNNKNMVRLVVFMIAMVMILICAALSIFFIGGTGGWVSFVVAAAVISALSYAVIEKIQ